jgi:hypothetical protein
MSYCVECTHCSAEVVIYTQEEGHRGCIIDLECEEYGIHVNFFDENEECFELAKEPIFSTIRPRESCRSKNDTL